MKFPYCYTVDESCRKTISFDPATGKTVTDTPNPFDFALYTGELDLTDDASVWAYINSTRVLGFPAIGQGYWHVVTKEQKQSERYRCNDKVVSRTHEYFNFARGPGLMLLDFDLKHKGAVMPGLRSLGIPNECLRVWYPSSSAMLCRGDQVITGNTGWHFILPIESQHEMQEIGRLLFLRAWLAGYGYTMYAKNGAVLMRSAIDNAVWQPERFVFGEANLRDGLRRAWGRSSYLTGEWGQWGQPWRYLSVADLWLSDAEQLKAAHLMAEAKAQAKRAPEGLSVLREFAMRTQGPGESVEQAITRVTAMSEINQLPPYLLLHTRLGDFTVKEVYENFDRFYGVELRDPLEPNYGDDPRIAIFRYFGPNQTGRGVYSNAHGGQTWLLMPAVVECGGAMSDVADPYISPDELANL